MIRYCCVLWIGTLLVSCNSNRIYEEFKEINGYWQKDSAAVFRVDIEDNSLPYTLNATISNRHTYPFYNLYFRYRIEGPGDSLLHEGLKEAILFDPKTGEPRGSGFGELFSHEVVLDSICTFPAPGRYTISLTQFMRRDTLPDIERVGVRVALSE